MSFPRNGEDMHYARQLAREAGLEAHLVAKVERAETVATVENMDDIIMASDVVMVARGDLRWKLATLSWSNYKNSLYAVPERLTEQ